MNVTSYQSYNNVNFKGADVFRKMLEGPVAKGLKKVPADTFTPKPKEEKILKPKQDEPFFDDDGGLNPDPDFS